MYCQREWNERWNVRNGSKVVSPFTLNLPKYLTSTRCVRFWSSTSSNWRLQEKLTIFHRKQLNWRSKKWILMKSSLPICTAQSRAIDSLLLIQARLYNMQIDCGKNSYTWHWLTALLCQLPGDGFLGGRAEKNENKPA